MEHLKIRIIGTAWPFRKLNSPPTWECSPMKNNWFQLAFLTHPRPLSSRREGGRPQGDGVSNNDNLTQIKIEYKD